MHGKIKTLFSFFKIHTSFFLATEISAYLEKCSDGYIMKGKV